MSVALMPYKPLLSQSELDFLRIINDNAGITASELREITGISKVTVFRKLTSLLGKGYIERRAHEGKAYHYYVKKGVVRDA